MDQKMWKKLSSSGKDLIKSFEGLRLKAYLDQHGIPTIGWGHILGVHLGMVISKDQAERFFDQDTALAETTINTLVRTNIDQNEFDALVSFRYNIGATAFSTSHLLQYLNQGNFILAAQQFPKWDHVSIKGVLVEDEGLKTRRMAEMNLFMRGIGVSIQVT